jgi:GNAT superfamily N-acetyltransferase
VSDQPRGPATPVLRRATGEDLGTVVDMLVRAFDDDPVPNYIFGDERVRRAGLRKFFTIQLRHGYLARGEVWTTEDRAGASVWGVPDTHRSALVELYHLAPAVPQLIRGGRPLDALRLLGDVDAARPKTPHWYLATLGTEPARQGQGVGSALLAPVLGRLDVEGLPAYLESSKERNVPFYARHGFEVTGEIHAPKGGPTLWLMWRDPR